MKIMKLGCDPEDIPESHDSRSRVISDLLRTALESGLTPVPVAEARIDRFSVGLPDHIAAQISALSEELGQSPAVVTAGLLSALKEAGNSLTESPPVEPVGDELSCMVSEPLRPLYRSVMEQLANGEISLAEGATGTGKGRLIAVIAASRLAVGAVPVVISAPLAVVQQLIADLQLVVPETPPAILLGRPNFIDPELLADWLIDNPHPELQAWLDTGCLPAQESTQALSSAIASPLAFLAEDAQALAGDCAPASSWLLTEDASPGCPALSIYNGLKNHAANGAKLIICSHMMLAVDNRAKTMTGGGPLPERLGTLLVDEAHLLEAAFASIYTTQMHLHASGRRVQRAKLPQQKERSLLAISGAINAQVTRLCGDDASPMGTINKFESLAPLLKSYSLMLEDLPKSTKKTPAETKSARRILQSERVAFNNAINGYSTLQLGVTPVLEYPTMAIGSSNLETPLSRLWERTNAAMLTSATLYLPDVYGVLHGGYSRWVMAVPKERVAYNTPVHPEWVTESARMHFVPASVEPGDTEQWNLETSQLIVDVVAQSLGGVLVLCTSYQTAHDLHALLEARLGDSLIVQSDRRSASGCAALFRQKRSAGSKPIWLAVGSAWAGVNLRDHNANPEDDFLLTDLVIPRIPFRTNRTLTHARRVRQLPSTELNETFRTLKQGLGRLIRSPGLKGRNIWFADRRIENKHVMYKTIRKMLEVYPQ